jgi:hypothetical protein
MLDINTDKRFRFHTAGAGMNQQEIRGAGIPEILRQHLTGYL